MNSNNRCLVLLIIACTSVMYIHAAITPVSPCSPNPCRNGGTCKPSKTTKLGYICTCPTGTYVPTCTKCTVCSPTQYQVSDCTPTTDRVCRDCTVCSATQYQVSDCTPTTDRVCRECTVCSETQYQVRDCTATTDRACKECTVCSATQYQVSECTPTTDRICQDCDVNPYTGYCKGYGYCYFHGDSHYVTFDGTTPYTFHYQGICKYLVSKPKVVSSALPYFEVYARGEYRYGGTSYAWARYVEIVYGTDTIRLSRDTTSPTYGVIDVTVNLGTVYPSPTYLGIGYSIYMSAGLMRFDASFGLIVEYDGVSEVRVYVPPAYSNDQLTGICGNFNKTVADDPTECNGYSYSGSPVNLFGDVCVVPDSDPDSCNCSYPFCPATTTYASDIPPCVENPPPEYVDQCQQLISENGPFADCIKQLQASSKTTSQELYDSCIMDACASNGEELCDSMRFLEKMCADLGIKTDTVALQKTTKCIVQPTVIDAKAQV